MKYLPFVFILMLLPMLALASDSNPNEVAYYTNATSLDGARAMAISGNYLYVVSDYNSSLSTFNLSAGYPSLATRTGYYENTTSLNGSVDLDILGNYLYVVSTGGDSITTFNITTPQTPVQTAYYTNATSLHYAIAVKTSGSYVYVIALSGGVSTDGTITTFDATTPQTPVQVASYENGTVMTDPRTLAISGNYLYVLSTNHYITTFNLSAGYPSLATQLSASQNTTNQGEPNDLAVNGGYLYAVGAELFGTGNTITTFDLSTPSAPVQVSTYTNDTSLNWASGISIVNDFAYVISIVSDSLTTFNLSAGYPSLATQTGYYTNGTSINGPYGIVSSGNYLYVASIPGDSVTTFNISNTSFEVSGCKNITIPGTYTMTNNITFNGSATTYCLKLLTNNTILDCGGFTITDNSTKVGFPIRSLLVENITVKNCNVSGGQQGIFLHGSASPVYYAKNITVTNNTVQDSGFQGIQLYYTNNSQVINSTILNIQYLPSFTGTGLYLEGIYNTNITNITSTGNYRSGIGLAGISTNITIINSNISNSINGNGIAITGNGVSGISIRNNTINNNKYYGFSITGGSGTYPHSNFTIFNNTVLLNGGYGYYFSTTNTSTSVTFNLTNNSFNANNDTTYDLSCNAAQKNGGGNTFRDQNGCFSNVTYGSPYQVGDASTAASVNFSGDIEAIVSMTCNYTLLQSDRVKGASTLWVSNSTGSNMSITNGTTWVSWSCTLDNYTAHWFLPALVSNCSCAQGTNFVQNLSLTSTIAKQYWDRNCTETNPSTTTAYLNATFIFADSDPSYTWCGGGAPPAPNPANNYTAQVITNVFASIPASTTYSTFQAANSTFFSAIAKPGWSQNTTPTSTTANQYIKENVTGDSNLDGSVEVTLGAGDFSACLAGAACNVSKNTTITTVYSGSQPFWYSANGSGDMLTDTYASSSAGAAIVNQFTTNYNGIVQKNITNTVGINWLNVLNDWSNTNSTCTANCTSPLNITALSTVSMSVGFSTPLTSNSTTTGVLLAFPFTANYLIDFVSNYSGQLNATVNLPDACSNCTYTQVYSCGGTCNTSSSVGWTLENYTRSMGIITLLNQHFSTRQYAYSYLNGTGVLNVTSCGTYPYSFALINISTNITGANADCLIFTGNNNTIFGNWNTVKTNGTNGTAITITGDNNTLENITVRDSGTGFKFNTTASNNQVRWIIVRNSTVGMYAVGNGTGNEWFASSISNCTRGLETNGAATGNLTFTNLNAYLNTYDLNMSGNISYDGGFNYWANCTGNCSWYTVFHARNESASADAYTDTANPTVNYGNVTDVIMQNGGTNTSWYQFQNTTEPTGKVYHGSSIFYFYAIDGLGDIRVDSSLNNGTFQESNITSNNHPTLGAGIASTDITAAAYYALTMNTVFIPTLENYSAVYGAIGFNLVPSFYNLGTFYFREKGAGTAPKFQYNWSYAFSDDTGTTWLTSNATTQVRHRIGISLSNSTYCSMRVATGSTRQVKLLNGTIITPIYSSASNNSNEEWLSWPCSPDTFYEVLDSLPLFVATNGTCQSNYTKVAQYFFLDQETENNVTANATVLITSNIVSPIYNIIQNSMSFNICAISNTSFNANVTVNYSNATSSIRWNIIPITQASNATVYLYLLSTATGHYYTFTVINEFNLPIANASLTLYHYSIPQGAWVAIEQQYTDFSGTAVTFLQPFVPHILVASATGYNTLNTSYTPSTITALTIMLTLTTGVNITYPDYEWQWNDTQYFWTPTSFYNYNATNATFQVICGNTSIEYYGMLIDWEWNGTTTTVYNTTIMGLSNGGILNFTANQTGTYTQYFWFKHAGYDIFNPPPNRFFVSMNETGASITATLLQAGNVMSPWAFYFLAVVCAGLVAGYVATKTGSMSGAAFAGLVILWGFTIFMPDADFGLCVSYTPPLSTIPVISCMKIWMATTITSLMVIAASVISWI